ncbi:MAG: orotidine-5'-phosphate decarboxylase [Bacteroidales bacterium]|nr:orotidine-5'-phosphate decarboxylase [Bacteroidales bacterium]MCF8389251.1 orotidine-5'-phosphate decarboxylase [Bacteroidales bacterium]
MNSRHLLNQIRQKESYLCIGLDTDFFKIPKFLLEFEYPLFEFNKRIIAATSDIAIAYKPNLAFYESLGSAGWMSLELTVNYIKSHHPEIFVIADAKRGDIGNTSKMYASAFFNHMDFDAITVAPYMGSDSVIPFLQYDGKWVILLGLTSNDGSQDFQMQKLATSKRFLYEEVMLKASEWGNTDQLMFVVGATQSDRIKKLRKIIPNHFLLIPGVGAQGGSLKDISLGGMNAECGIIVNSSRNIIYADGTENFDKVARDKSLEIKAEMSTYLKKKKII